MFFGGVVMIRGNLLLGLRPMAPPGDRFEPDRVGLDHLSFGVASRDDLEQAKRLLGEYGVKHGEIASLPSFGIDVLGFEDPDGVQLELTARAAPAGWIWPELPGQQSPRWAPPRSRPGGSAGRTLMTPA